MVDLQPKAQAKDFVYLWVLILDSLGEGRKDLQSSVSESQQISIRPQNNICDESRNSFAKINQLEMAPSSALSDKHLQVFHDSSWISLDELWQKRDLHQGPTKSSGMAMNAKSLVIW